MRNYCLNHNTKFKKYTSLLFLSFFIISSYIACYLVNSLENKIVDGAAPENVYGLVIDLGGNMNYLNDVSLQIPVQYVNSASSDATVIGYLDQEVESTTMEGYQSDYPYFYTFNEGAYASNINLQYITNYINEQMILKDFPYRIIIFDILSPETWVEQAVTIVCTEQPIYAVYGGLNDFELNTFYYGLFIKANWATITEITLDNAGGIGGTTLINIVESEKLPYEKQITPPIKEGYTFLGYFNGDTQYINANGQVIQYESLWSSVPNTLVAHWQSLEINLTLTLNCTNFNNQSYTIYVFVDNELIQQVIPISDTIHINIVAEPNCDNIYVQFVRNYYTNINANGDNIAQIGRKVYLLEFIDTTINYSISIPNVNIGIVV